MVVQNQSELGEGSANLTDPHHTPTIIQSSTQPQKTQKPRKPKRKDTQVPQPSDPSKNVTDEVVHKELGDILVRAATIASSLEAEQDSGNITKTRSKAIPNESISLGTTSGCDSRCQETMGGTISQTRFENVSKHSNDLLLAKGNTLHSDEDRLKLDELMALRVKKLKKKNRSRTYRLKRLYKVGLIARVESSRDEESLGEDASKQERINAIDADEDITLVSVQDDADKEMFDVDALNGEEVFVAGQNENVVKEIVDVAQVSTAATTVIITTEEITMDQALEALKTLKPKAKIDIDHQLAERLQAKEQEEFIQIEDFRTELVEGKEKRARTELAQEITKMQKVEDDKETTEIKKRKKKLLSNNKSYLIIADGKSQMYMFFSQMLKSFDRGDLEDLYKLVKAKYESTRLVEDLDLVLWNDLKTMFEPHVEDKIYMLVEKKYPLTPSTLTMMLEKKLMIDYESEMAYQLLKFIIKQLKKRISSLGGIVRIKSLLDAVRITAAQVYVNNTLMKLVLLMDFKENMLRIRSIEVGSTLGKPDQSPVSSPKASGSQKGALQATHLNTLIRDAATDLIHPELEDLEPPQIFTAMSSEEKPKIVKKNDDALIIKEWVSDYEEEDASQPKIEKKTVRPSIVKKELVKSK
ncbi:hypothetical protein Tco_0352919 [Tanacetum coccineum]